MESNLLKLTDAEFPLAIIEHHKTISGALFSAHQHEHLLQIFYLISGSVTFYNNRNKYELKDHDICCINQGDIHYAESHLEDVRYYVFRLDISQLLSNGIPALNHRYLNGINNGTLRFKPVPDLSPLRQLLDNMIITCRLQKRGYEFELMGEMYSILSLLIQNARDLNFRPEDTEILMKKTKRFIDVFLYIEENYSNKITLEQLAVLSHMSKEYFIREFKKCTGRTPIDYLNRLRIEKAVFLLNQGCMNVTDAGKAVGFDDVNYFSRLFKKYMKESPVHYKQDDRKYLI